MLNSCHPHCFKTFQAKKLMENYLFGEQELNITPKPTKNKTKEALKATQAKDAKRLK